MNCNNIDLFDYFAAQKDDNDEKRAAIAKHIQKCDICRKKADKIQNLVKIREKSKSELKPDQRLMFYLRKFLQDDDYIMNTLVLSEDEYYSEIETIKNYEQKNDIKSI